jgi:hypothetical protein
VRARLARDDPQTLYAATIGAAWLAVAERILADGTASTYDGLPVREISHVTLAVEHPDPAAHVYQAESGYVRGVLDQSKRRALG